MYIRFCVLGGMVAFPASCASWEVGCKNSFDVVSDNVVLWTMPQQRPEVRFLRSVTSATAGCQARRGAVVLFGSKIACGVRWRKLGVGSTTSAQHQGKGGQRTPFRACGVSKKAMCKQGFFKPPKKCVKCISGTYGSVLEAIKHRKRKDVWPREATTTASTFSGTHTRSADTWGQEFLVVP